MFSLFGNLATAIVLMAATAASAQVTVIDGDTLDVDGVRYRIEGIDAPEHGQKCGSWACGKAATSHLRELTEGHDVMCSAGSEDDYERIVATCWVDDVELGRTMVLAGLAWAFIKYSDTYLQEEAQARQSGIGIWSEQSQPAWEFRAERWTVAKQEAPSGCPIKGNISKSGRIYHAPWSPWYSRTKVSVTKGEKWFCSEQEALKAGWRPPIWGK